MNIEKHLEKLPFKEVVMGYQRVIFFDSKELQNAQLGYSINKKGESLTGTDIKPLGSHLQSSIFIIKEHFIFKFNQVILPINCC